VSGLRAAAFWPTLVEWLPPNDALDRPQLQLATVDPSGSPDVRTVLLTEFDDDGFWFNTDSASRKIEQLRAEPRVALALVWPEFSWQLVVQGVASTAPEEQSRRAYAARSPYLKQLAWQNTAEFAQLPHEQRKQQWAEFTAGHDLDALGPSPTWTGVLVRPTRLTFWRSDPDAASQRTEYRLEGGDWVQTFLPG
jgi:pyridoxamine 5'-phosphate oxidase